MKRRKPVTRRPKAPKPLPPPKPERPRRTHLKEIYRDLISVDRDQRINTLARAMTWYDQAQAYLGYKQKGEWTKEQLKFQDQAQKARLLGMKNIFPLGKENMYLQVISYYEQMMNGFKPPKVASYLAVLKTKADKLQERKEKLKDRYGDFLDLISRALQPKNADGKRIKLRVDKISASYRISSEGDVTFDRKLVQHLRRISRKQGILTGVLQMLPVLSESASRVPELDPQQQPTGRQIVQDGKRYRAVLEMLNCLNQYSLSEQGPKKLVRKPKPKTEQPEQAEGVAQ